MRQFYVASPTVQTPSGQSPVPSIVQALSGQLDISFPLSWSHYVRLLTVTDEKAGLLRAGGATGRLVCEGTGSPAATKKTNAFAEERAAPQLLRLQKSLTWE